MEQRVDKIITGIVREALNALYKGAYADAEVHVEHPANKSWGDYSTNVAMVGAKKLGKAPNVLAREIVDFIQDSDEAKNILEKVETAGPGFINFTLKKDFLISKMLSVLKDGAQYGSSREGEGIKVALEHSNVNPNKAAHIGHLRNAVIGQFLEHVYVFLGYDVNVQYYSNDLGVQVSTSLLGTQKLSSVIKPEDYEKFDHYAWDVYTRISQMLLENKELRKELEEIMVKLDNRDPQISIQQKKLADRVLQDNLLTFSKLDIDYDLVVYESSIKDMKMWETTFEMLKKNPYVYFAEEGPSKGCWLVKMSAEQNGSSDIEEDKIIVRSNGIPTYTGKDIAYHMWKFGILPVDFGYKKLLTNTQEKTLYETSDIKDLEITFSNNNKVLDVIDVKQTYAIDAVKKSLAYLGYIEYSDNLVHVNYGHVYLSKETAVKIGLKHIEDACEQVAMSGRKGMGVKIDDFIDIVDKSLKDTHGEFPNAVGIRNAAIKYDMLRYDTFQDVVFDVDESTNFKGFSGPYIEYTHSRACSLLTKAGEESLDAQKLSESIVCDINASSLNVLRSLYKFPEVVSESARRYAPNLLCTYLYELCQDFNTFYNDSPVLKEPDENLKKFKLALTAATKQVISNGLYLLGIHAVDKM